ncbi:MAG: hypothetical protein WAK55_01665 [Xanthobacteraceae bacterium]
MPSGLLLSHGQDFPDFFRRAVAAIAREITIGQFPKFPVSITGSANVHADATIG